MKQLSLWNEKKKHECENARCQIFINSPSQKTIGKTKSELSIFNNIYICYIFEIFQVKKTLISENKVQDHIESRTVLLMGSSSQDQVIF